MQRAWRTIGAAGGIIVLMSVATQAQEFCITCTAPTATYRCVIEKSLPTGGIPLKDLCVATLTREGRHANCRVRGGTVFDCVGPIKRVSDPAAKASTPPSLTSVPGTAVAPARPEQGDAAPRSPDAPPADQGPPRTLEEMARRMGKSSGDGLGKAGTAVEDAAKKSWGCLSTFFKEC